MGLIVATNWYLVFVVGGVAKMEVRALEVESSSSPSGVAKGVKGQGALLKAKLGRKSEKGKDWGGKGKVGGGNTLQVRLATLLATVL